ncbi:MAG: hypothetical protein EOM19_03695 [Candidatus Moranbacteria bacterium]|nr:hypothetical protein [Candidatus Moranbacteria bacterium]
MIYQHKYFQLDTESKRIFDENGKELVLRGNAYRMLVFLCANKNATLTQIGDFLDWAKDYTENHLRQYRYKINTIIGYSIIEYKNGIYSLIGDTKEGLEIVKNERNTDLLHQDFLKSKARIDGSQKSMKCIKTPAIIAIALLLLSFLGWPYGYYSFLRIAITGIALYYTYYIHRELKKYDFWFWSMVAVAILFNPIAPIYLERATWEVIDILIVVFFGVFIGKSQKK